MSQQPNVVDLVTEAVVARFRDDIAPRIDDAVRNVQIDAQMQLDEFLRGLPLSPIPGVTPADAKADAKSRAGRTAVQGAVATAMVAGSLAIAGVISGGEFDFTSGGDWKAVAGAALGAILAAGAAYVQRIINPPNPE